MFIETEGTPNPATLKFLPGCEVMGLSTADFASAVSAIRSPLATALFELPGVARVFPGRRLRQCHQERRTVLAGAEAAGARRYHGPFRCGTSGYRG